MTFESEHAVLENRFKNSWGTTTPVKYQGMKYTPRDGLSYVSFKVLPGAGAQITLGSSTNLHRTLGYINVDIYSPTGKGLQAMKGLVDIASAIFRGVNIASATIQCREPRYYDQGEDKGWYLLTVEIPFQRDINL